MAIPYNVIEDIKHRNNIEDIISQYLTLSRAGSNLKGLCPFHSEKTPSFTVFPANQNFYCFGCGVGGDVISFIMRAENLEYIDALQFLADRSGIVLPKESHEQQRGASRTRILEMNVCAAKFFRNCLFDETIGKPAREYINQRKLSQATVKHFGLGYSPNSFTALRDHLASCGYTYDEMIEGYLCARSPKNKSVYDIFRGRLIIPIIDVSGNIVAFGGRIMGDGTPKYLNSGDTPAFKKSKNLFALNYSKVNCAEKMILCEGYMDVIQLHQAGFENAVATLGTAITQEHARIMKRYTKKVIIAYDSDAAGQNASDKAFKMLDEVGLDAKVLHIEGAKDPDEYIKKFGAKSFEKVLDQSRSKFEFVLENIKKKYNVEDPDDKIKLLKELCEYLSTIYSSVEKEIYIERVSKMFEVDVNSIKRDVQIFERRNNKKKETDTFKEIIRASSGNSDRVNYDFAKKPKIARLEEIVLGLLMYNQAFYENKVNGKSISKDDFETSFGQKLFEQIETAINNGGFDLGLLSETLTQDEVSRAVELIAKRQQLTQNNDAVFNESLLALRNEIAIERNRADNKEDITAILERRRNENNSN